MIKFFRKIRKKLLSESKFSQYLLYAIGEIVLVVLGILIALQINNWNTTKQDSETLHGYLNNISQNIKADQEKLDLIMAFRDSSIFGSRYFMKMIAQTDITIEEYTTYFSKYFQFNPWLDESFQYNSSGFDALKNSGYLSKIQQTTIESELYRYYSLVEKIEDEEQSLNNFMEEMEYDMYKNNIVQSIKPLISKLFRNLASQAELEELQGILNYPAFVGSHSRNAGTDYMNELYSELSEVAVTIQNEIKSANLTSN